MPKRVIVVLVDGLPADRFPVWRPRLHALDALARDGLWVERLTPPTPATSLPGRATLLTGRDTAAHGVYGNNLLDGADFRSARADDLRVPTLARVAARAGRRVAGLGFGLVDAADTVAHVDPWWQHREERGETNAKIPGLPIRHDPQGILAGLVGVAPRSQSPLRSEQGRWHGDLQGLMADHDMLELAGDLACGAEPPDLILAEVAVTDSVMHYQGLDTGASRWVWTMADLFLGRLVERLRAAGRWEDTVLAVVSDHGHEPVATALYPEALLPGAAWASEGASLHVRVPDADARRRATEALAPYGVRPLPGHHLPHGVEGVAAFAAPQGMGFESRPADAPPDAVQGAPIVISTHGNHPGAPCDDALCILGGGGVATARVAQAPMAGFAATVAALLGIDLGPEAAAPFA